MKKYLHPENINKEFIDWRDPSRREQLFVDWLYWRLKYSDLDHYMVNNCYIDSEQAKRLNPDDIERKLWFSIIFGFTYQSSMAWTIFWHFPDFFNIDLTELENWNNTNYSRQFYAKDTRYNKGKIVQQISDIKNNLEKSGHKSFQSLFNSLLKDNETDSFFNIFNKVREFKLFGRMTTWLCCQVLNETANIKMDAPTVFADDPSNGSVRKGLSILFNKENEEVSNAQYLVLERQAMEVCKEKLPSDQSGLFSNFLLESQLCQFKKLLCGGDYAGHSSGDHVSRATKFKEAWQEVDYSPFFNEAIKNHNPEIQGLRESKALRDLCTETGQLINMDKDFPNLPNMYLELGLNKELLLDSHKNNSHIKDLISNYKQKIS